MARTNVSPLLPDRTSPLLDVLPGEIRNQIIEICILNALRIPLSTTSKSKLSGLKVSVLPRWHGPGCLRVEGIRALPLIFVNKQLHDEVLTYLDSMVEELTIGGYVLQFPNEDSRTRWNLVYSMLEKRPTLRKYVQDIKIFLPREGNEQCRWHWTSLGLPVTKMKQGHSKVWSILPSLEQSLNSFSAIQKLTVIVTVENAEPPDFGKLISLYKHYGDRITVEMKAGMCTTGPQPWRGGVSVETWVEKWKTAWESCVTSQG